MLEMCQAKSRRKLTDEQIEYFIKIVPNHSEQEIIQFFNNKFQITLTKHQVGNYKHKFKVKSGTVGGRFEKGSIPYNKGKKWDDYMSKQGQINSMKTTFQKGKNVNNQRHKWRNVGDERLDKDGYILVRTNERSTKSKTNNIKWVGKHNLIWEEHYGKVPQGSVIIFADGDKRNFDINNLICVSRYELLVLNKNNLIKKYSNLTKSGVLVAKLYIKVNEVKKAKRGGENGKEVK